MGFIHVLSFSSADPWLSHRSCLASPFEDFCLSSWLAVFNPIVYRLNIVVFVSMLRGRFLELDGFLACCFLFLGWLFEVCFILKIYKSLLGRSMFAAKKTFGLSETLWWAWSWWLVEVAGRLKTHIVENKQRKKKRRQSSASLSFLELLSLCNGKTQRIPKGMVFGTHQSDLLYFTVVWVVWKAVFKQPTPTTMIVKWNVQLSKNPSKQSKTPSQSPKQARMSIICLWVKL